MRKFGLIGYPLGHSFSKKYFSEKFLNEKIIDSSYENYPLKHIAEFPALISSDESLCGLNVTIPYKTEIIGYLDYLDREAEEVGAVNVIKIRREPGRIGLNGYNSDITGIRDTVHPYLNESVRKALVLGTGGSSKAVCHVLKNLGLEVTLVSRERKPGILSYSDLDDDIIEKTQLIVNTTPLGMFPNTTDRPDIDYNRLTSDHILFDLVYNPQDTAFLKAGVVQGSRTISGITMLHSQAEKAWEIWNDDTK
jgi:shikimate dehydrogenase